jgi:hypothetical protein
VFLIYILGTYFLFFRSLYLLVPAGTESFNWPTGTMSCPLVEGVLNQHFRLLKTGGAREQLSCDTYYSYGVFDAREQGVLCERSSLTGGKIAELGCAGFERKVRMYYASHAFKSCTS